nr:hypothetical protein [Tanacetum cinerariifolium]
AISLILGIVDKYLDNQMNEAMKVAVQLQLDRLRDEAQAKNEDFLNKLDENIKKIIKEQVKEQVKAQVSKILPKIKKTINEQLENEVLTRSSSESNTSHAIAANLSELELKKILIDKMEINQSTDLLNRRISTKHCNLARKDYSRDSFNELMDTPLDFSVFVMNRLKVDTLIPVLLIGLTFELMKGSCKSLVKLGYFFEEVYKATTDQLEWNNPKGNLVEMSTPNEESSRS